VHELREERAKFQAEQLNSRINRLSGLSLRLEPQGNYIVLFNNEGPVGYWQTWQAAYRSVWSSVHIVEQALLHKVLLGGNAAIVHELVETRKKLAQAQTELSTALAERDLYLQAAAQFVKRIDASR
jgi:hypothetical protein